VTAQPFCSGQLAGFAGSNPAAGGMGVCLFECCLISGRGLRDGLITRPEESYLVCFVWVWLWNLDNVVALAHWGRRGGAVALWKRQLEYLVCRWWLSYVLTKAINFVMFVCLSAWNNSSPTGRVFMKFDIEVFLKICL
jgi:hypothetical protein